MALFIIPIPLSLNRPCKLTGRDTVQYKWPKLRWLKPSVLNLAKLKQIYDQMKLGWNKLIVIYMCINHHFEWSFIWTNLWPNEARFYTNWLSVVCVGTSRSKPQWEEAAFYFTSLTNWWQSTQIQPVWVGDEYKGTSENPHTCRSRSTVTGGVPFRCSLCEYWVWLWKASENTHLGKALQWADQRARWQGVFHLDATYVSMGVIMGGIWKHTFGKSNTVGRSKSGVTANVPRLSRGLCQQAKLHEHTHTASLKVIYICKGKLIEWNNLSHGLCQQVKLREHTHTSYLC